MVCGVQMYISVILCCFWLTLHISHTQGCDLVQLLGVESTDHYSLTGVYQVSEDEFCSDRAVYKQMGGVGYMFYRSDHWIVGDRLCVTSGSLKVEGGAEHPVNVSSRWEESVSGGWRQSPGALVRCFKGFTGCHEVELRGIGTPGQYEMSGVYRNTTTQMCSGRPVYAQLGNSFYLSNMFGHWVVGYQPCVVNVAFKAMDSAFAPEDITVGWEMSVAEGWRSTPDVSIICHAHFSGCPYIEVSGIEQEAYHVLNAVYKRDATSLCTGRDVYVARDVSSTYHVYYKHGHWIIGDFACAVSGALKTSDAALYVENVTRTWEVSVGSSWQYSATVRTSCFTGFAGCNDIVVVGGYHTDLYTPALAYGVYTHQEDSSCTDRPVYQQRGGLYSVYYLDGYWTVGVQPCTDIGVLRAPAEVTYPEDVRVTWHELNGQVWVTRDSVSISCHYSYTGCSRVEVRGAKERYDAIGVYEASDDFCNGRRVYTTPGGDMYLYYTSGLWVIGHQMCRDNFTMRVRTAELYPEVANRTWDEMSGGKWTPNDDVIVACHTGFQGCERLDLRLTMSQTELEGAYTVDLDNLCNGRYTYQHALSRHVLYSTGGLWVIGKTRCSDADVLMKTDAGGLYPDVTRWRWSERTDTDGGAIWHTSPAAVLCSGRHVMKLSGTRYRHSAVGTYDVTATNTCDGRVVLKQRGGDLYLYSVGNTSWYIGVVPCRTSAVLSVTSDAGFPGNISGVWAEFQSNSWIPNNNISLDVDTGFSGCPQLSVTYATGVTNVYSVTDVTLTCNGRYTYRHSSGRYVYAVGDQWVIGSVRCSSEVGIGSRVEDNAMYPENIRATWRMAFGDDTLHVRCREGCEQIELVSASPGLAKAGIYTKLPQTSTCSGRNSYKHTQSDLKLYYIPQGAESFRGWMVGPVLCLEHGDLRVWDAASYPEDVVHAWSRLNDTRWQHLPDVHLACVSHSGTDSPGGSIGDEQTTTALPVVQRHSTDTIITITAIVVAGLVALVIIIIVTVVCLKRNKSKTPHTVNQVYMNPAVSTDDEMGSRGQTHAVRMSDIANPDVTADNVSKYNDRKQYEKLAE